MVSHFTQIYRVARLRIYTSDCSATSAHSINLSVRIKSAMASTTAATDLTKWAAFATPMPRELATLKEVAPAERIFPPYSSVRRHCYPTMKSATMVNRRSTNAAGRKLIS